MPKSYLKLTCDLTLSLEIALLSLVLFCTFLFCFALWVFHVVQGHDDELRGRGMATPVAVGGRHRQSRLCEIVTSRGSELDKDGDTDARSIAWLACSARPQALMSVVRDVSVIWPNERSYRKSNGKERPAQRREAVLPCAGRLVICFCFLVRNNTYDIRATFQNRQFSLP